MYECVNSKYVYEGTEILKNRLNIKNEKRLKEYEVKMVAVKTAILMKENKKHNFDEEYFKYIHYFLFCDVYDFAGIYREENILKDNFIFSDFRYISDNIKDIFKKINIEKMKTMKFNELISFISEIMTDLNVLHPFREGNGRATREFIREILLELGYKINFFEIDYDEIVEVSKEAVVNDEKQIALLKKYIKLV